MWQLKCKLNCFNHVWFLMLQQDLTIFYIEIWVQVDNIEDFKVKDYLHRLLWYIFWIVNFFHFKFANYLQVCYHSQQSGFVNIIHIFNQWKHFWSIKMLSKTNIRSFAWCQEMQEYTNHTKGCHFIGILPFIY